MKVTARRLRHGVYKLYGSPGQDIGDDYLGDIEKFLPRRRKGQAPEPGGWRGTFGEAARTLGDESFPSPTAAAAELGRRLNAGAAA